MSTPIIMHINYCEQGQSIEEACRKAVAWGYDGIEFRQITRETQSDPVRYYDAVAAAMRSSGLKHVIFGGPPTKIITVQGAAREEGIAEQERYFRLAAERFPLTVWNLRSENLSAKTPSGETVRGSAAATEEHWQAATEAYRYLGGVAQELGIKLAFETHGGNLTDLPAVTLELVRRIDHPAVGVNLDYGNMLPFPDADPLEQTIRSIGNRLYYVHLKNGIRVSGSTYIKTSLADGEINNRAFLRVAREVGYDGPICVEAPRNGDREWFAQEDLAYIRSVLRDLARDGAW